MQTKQKMKICKCEREHMFFCTLGIYRCQYCGGVLSDLLRVKTIIDKNTEVNLKDRDIVIENKLAVHQNFIEGWVEKE